VESEVANRCHAEPDADVGEASAARESKFTNVGDAVREGELRQTSTIRKCVVSDARDAVWNCNAAQAGAAENVPPCTVFTGPKTLMLRKLLQPQNAEFPRKFRVEGSEAVASPVQR
jgi:hypothetical protein